MADLAKHSRKDEEDDDYQASGSESEGPASSDYDPEAEMSAPRRTMKENKAPAAKTPGSKAKTPNKTQEKVIERLRKSLATSIKAQMVFKKSLKYSSSRINVEIPNLTLADLEGIMGSVLYGKASKGPKQVSVTTAGAELYDLFGCHLTKDLRYGATLCIKDDALKLVFSKETKILKATGLCVMVK